MQVVIGCDDGQCCCVFRIVVVVPVSSICSVITILLPSTRFIGDTVRREIVLEG